MFYLAMFGIVIAGVITAHYIICFINSKIDNMANHYFDEGIKEGRAIEYHEAHCINDI